VGGRFNAAPLAPTIARLQALGIANIVLVGPVPTWNDDLRRILFRHFARNPARQLPPLRLRNELDPALAPTAAALRSFAAERGLTFVSPLDVFCDGDGCLTRIGNPPTQITAIDYGHLSSQASIYLAYGMAGSLFAPAPAGARAVP